MGSCDVVKTVSHTFRGDSFETQPNVWWIYEWVDNKHKCRLEWIQEFFVAGDWSVGEWLKIWKCRESGFLFLSALVGIGTFLFYGIRCDRLLRLMDFFCMIGSLAALTRLSNRITHYLISLTSMHRNWWTSERILLPTAPQDPWEMICSTGKPQSWGLRTRRTRVVFSFWTFTSLLITLLR